MNRPCYQTPAVQQAAVNKMLPKVLAWLKDGNGEQDEAAVRKDLEKVIDAGDGYQIVRSLDRYHHWDADSQLVEIMEDAPFALSDALREAERRWVEETGQKPAKQCGDICAFDYRGSIYTGEITEIHPHGYYTVFCPILGHVRWGVGTHGTILPWEKVT